MKKDKFTKLIGKFMQQVALLDKLCAFEDVLDNPNGHNLGNEQVEGMMDVISFHKDRYSNVSNRLQNVLVDVFTGGEEIQKEHLGFTMDLGNNKESIAELFDILFNQLFTFTRPALNCNSDNYVSVFLKTLKKELES